MATTLRIFRGAGGYYLAHEDEQGFHRQPAPWATGAYFPTFRAAKRALAAAAERDDDDGWTWDNRDEREA